MKTYHVNKEGYYGEFGGAYVPEILHRYVEELQNVYLDVLESESFRSEYDNLLRNYVGAPHPSTWHNGCRKNTVVKSTSNAKTSTTPAHTKSTTP